MKNMDSSLSSGADIKPYSPSVIKNEVIKKNIAHIGALISGILVFYALQENNFLLAQGSYLGFMGSGLGAIIIQGHIRRLKEKSPLE